LMIVVAIIGILAAIAIPNFLTYQLKSRQAEAKTNLQAIKTSEIAFQAERGCFVGVTNEGSPVVALKSVPTVWGAGLLPTPAPAAWCTALFTAKFSDIGFKATGNVMYLYGVDATTGPAAGYTSAVSCALYPALAMPAAVGVGGENNFVAVAKTDLDGDGTKSTWDSSVDHGAADCTTGVY